MFVIFLLSDVFISIFILSVVTFADHNVSPQKIDYHCYIWNKLLHFTLESVLYGEHSALLRSASDDTWPGRSIIYDTLRELPTEDLFCYMRNCVWILPVNIVRLFISISMQLLFSTNFA